MAFQRAPFYGESSSKKRRSPKRSPCVQVNRIRSRRGGTSGPDEGCRWCGSQCRGRTGSCTANCMVPSRCSRWAARVRLRTGMRCRKHSVKLRCRECRSWWCWLGLDIERVLEAVTFGYLGFLHQRSVGPLLECLAEDIALATGESRFIWIGGGNGTIQPSCRQQRQSEA